MLIMPYNNTFLYPSVLIELVLKTSIVARLGRVISLNTFL